MKPMRPIVAAAASIAMIGAAASPTITLPTREQFSAYLQTAASHADACQEMMIETNKLTSPPYTNAPEQDPLVAPQPSLLDWQTESEAAIDCLTLVQREGASDAAQSVPRNFAAQGCSALKAQYHVPEARCAGFASSPSPFADAPPGRSAATAPRLTQPEPLCIIKGSVEWDASSDRVLVGVPLDKQAVSGPLKGAHVRLTGVGTTQVTQADAHGDFRFTAPVGSYTIEFQAPGYVPVRMPISVALPLSGNICLDVGTALRPTNLAKQPSNASSGNPFDVFTAAYQNAANQYCKTHPGAPCAYFMQHGPTCMTVAINAEQIYIGIIRLKLQGLSATQAVNEIVEGWAQADSVSPELVMPHMVLSDVADIAWAAARLIYPMKTYNADAPEAFAHLLVESACLKAFEQ